MAEENDVKVAVLENKVQHVQEDVQELKTDVKDGFDKVHEAIKELKERNSVTEFFRENWKVVTVVIGLAVGGNGWEVAKMILPSLLGTQ